MQFTISWHSDNVRHTDHFLAEDVNMWRDIFPDSIRPELIGMNVGDTIHHSLFTNEILKNNHTSSLSLPLSCWQPPTHDTTVPCPMAGRYYPLGFMHGVSGVYPQTVTPMRVITVHNKIITIDINHPLDGRQLEIEIELKNVEINSKERGGRCSDRLQDVLNNGPGMQARFATSPISFDPETADQRADGGNDSAFYAEPRMVSHIDSQASEHLASVCNDLIQPGSKVLDLMASVDSHLPEEHKLEVTGLGMNREEMAENKDLHDYVIHDLNEDTKIPFPDKSFDAVVCNLSIEYLTQPQEVIRDIARVLKTSGTVLISFSNRWFPPKVTRLWTELHEFERMGYVLQLCWPFLDKLETRSFRNWPRPVTDKYFPTMQKSDPLYVITGKLRS